MALRHLDKHRPELFLPELDLEERWW